MTQKKEILETINEELIKFMKGEQNTLREAIKELTDAFGEYVLEFEEFKKINDKLQAGSIELTNGNIALVTTLKSIHLILGQHRSKLNKLKDMPALMTELDTFVLSPAAINVGVIEKAKEEVEK